MVRFDASAARNTDRSYLDPAIIHQRLQTLTALALKSGESVLDAGCGSGLLAELMSAQVGESGSVTGLDQSPDMLELATNRCKQLGNVELRLGDITSLDPEAGSFDAASCIQTLLYVDEIEKAIAELHRVLKPGGRIGIIETDWHSLVINSPDYATTRLLTDAWDSTVPSPNLPPRLPGLLQGAGFSAIRVQAIAVINDSYIEAGYGASMLRYLVKNAVKHGAVKKEQAENWLQQMTGPEIQQEFFFCINRFLFTAIK